jgi:hypothetical protein
VAETNSKEFSQRVVTGSKRLLIAVAVFAIAAGIMVFILSKALKLISAETASAMLIAAMYVESTSAAVLYTVGRKHEKILRK